MKVEKKASADETKEKDAVSAENMNEAEQAADPDEDENAEEQPKEEEAESGSEAAADVSEDGETGEESGDAEEDPKESDNAGESEGGKSDAEKSADDRAKELDEREKTLLARELRATAIEELAKEQLPSALADCFRYDSEASYRQSKESVVKAFQGALKEAVDARLRGKPPKTAESAKAGKSSGHSFSDIINKNKVKR
ncbi:MAG: hypothetical protein NC409_12575 [Clostridium sp.]|nr:hypothetical protein [Clostridium sp.]